MALVLGCAALWVVLSGDEPEPQAFAVTVHGLVIVAPIAAGFYALFTLPAPARRFGWVLLLAALLWSPTLLAESADGVAYSLGRVAVWLAEAVFVYVALAYPSGRLVARVDRLLVGSALVVVGVLLLPIALLDQQYPVPSPWSSCGSDCPANALAAVSSEPGFVDAFLVPVAGIASFAVYAGAALVLAGRLAGSGRSTGAGRTPVLALAASHMVAAAAFVALRGRFAHSEVTDFLGLVALLCMPAFSVAFVAGLLRSRRAAGRALARLGADPGGRTGPTELRDAIAQAVEDPTLEIAYWSIDDAGGWVDAHGDPVALEPLPADRRLTEVRGRDGRIAVLIHDAALEHAAAVDHVGCGFAVMALQNQRLETQLTSALGELRASRARILSAADRERRHIERDLHDGAQQRLVGLGIQLALTAELVEADPKKAAGRLRELAGDVDEAVDEVRSLAQGLVPPLLVERGLADALREAAASSPLAATVRSDGLGRYGPEIESAVYFCCLEALQNAGKHAAGARAVSVTLWKDEELRFEVRDDGPGLPDGPHQHGAGLTNMRDRLGAVGGRLTIESAHGEGTCVSGAAPLAPVDLPAQGETLLLLATDALEDRLAVYRAVRGGHGRVVDFVIEHVNEAACAELGLDRDELVGRRLGEVGFASPEPADLGWLLEVLDEGERDSRTRIERDVHAVPLGGGRLLLTWRDLSARARPIASSGPRSRGRAS